METKKQPKSILKKTTPARSAELAPPAAAAVAVQHAEIIHHRRELEDTINDSIIELAKFPSTRTPPYTSSNPAPDDAAAFKSHIRLFQPSDYDDLIEERNLNGLCGYALCAKPRRKVNQAGEWKLVNFGRKDFSIVPKKEFEKWCSQACTKRALYVKVQLNETAAWERAGISSIQIDLYESPEDAKEDDAATKVAKDLERLKIDAQQKANKDAKDLAVERGMSGKKQQDPAVDVTIKENKVMFAAKEPTQAEDEEGHLVTEGYKSRFKNQKGIVDGHLDGQIEGTEETTGESS